ncbi:aspartyl aminopeptidase [Rhizodiscina lignyota]|uniref:Aspartyl aminopeptidase n=1 Tax=Rhizodiscina lignyota TaxID=1504668 RepID=A0A9P4IAT0_9PEZI|nr:aspartyl aminopeptidase [Rhizodiscina lignyota]
MFERLVSPAGSQYSQHAPFNPFLQPAVASPPKPSSKIASTNTKAYAKPFCDFLTNNPTVFHAVSSIASDLSSAGFTKLSERDVWKPKRGGKYYVERNGSALIAFEVGAHYEPGNGVAILAGHVDALTAKLKPVPKKSTVAGYDMLGVAPYAGSLNSTWWDRDLGIGGRVLVKESSGKIATKLVKLDWPIARIPTLAPHFGAAAAGPFNKETQMVPIIGIDLSSSSTSSAEPAFQPSPSLAPSTFTSTQPEKLVRAIAGELNISDYSTIVNWELELFDVQPATLLGIDKEFISACRIDDKLCSWSAIQGLLESVDDPNSSIIKLVGLFDDEEIGSLLRQGARGNYLPSVIERVVTSFDSSTPQLILQTYANSFMVSSDVTHAVNPNFLGSYLEHHSPRLNTGLTVAADSNGHMTTDAVSTAILTRCCDIAGQKLQVFQIRNDSRSGGTVGPMLSAAMGVRAIDAGMAQLSMHSIRAMTGAEDPGLGVKAFKAFLDNFEKVDQEFRE